MPERLQGQRSSRADGRDGTLRAAGAPDQAAAAAGSPAWVQSLLDLQATAGNAAVTAMLRSAGAPVGSPSLASGSWKYGRHPDFPTSMGQTWYAINDIGTWPSFNLEFSRSFLPPFNYQARPKTTDAVGSAWPVLVTPENENGYKMPTPRPEYPDLDYYIRVSGQAANNIAAAEQQHVNDLDEGWSLTGIAAKRAINQAAGEDWSEGPDLAAARSAAIEKTVGYMGGLGPKVKSTLESGGSLKPALGPMMDKTFSQSHARRDASGGHTIPVQYVTKDPDGTKVLYEADPNKAPADTATSSVINLGTIG